MRRTGTALAIAITLSACSTTSPPAGPRPHQPPHDGGIAAPDAGRQEREDAGVLVEADEPPPPISGGTLAVSADGRLIVAADPDLDTISIVDTERMTLLHTIELEDGDEPGRVVLDDSGRAHVVLRSAGAIVDVDVATGTVIGRRAVCAVPRGIAWRPSDDMLFVACAEGILVSMPNAGRAPARVLRVADDLRDVVISGDDLYVTTFRSAHLLQLDESGAIVADRTPSELEAALVRRVTIPGPFQPAVAWRAIPTASGVMMLHQRALSAEFPTEGGYGAEGCGSGIVHGAVSELVDGVMRSGGPLERVILGVDVAVSPDGARIAVASPGTKDRQDLVIPLYSTRDDVQVFERTEATTVVDRPCVENVSGLRLLAVGTAIAVAFLPDGRLVAQSRSPAALAFSALDDGFGEVIELSSANTFSTGHVFFHRSTAGDIACASCHPEGGDDGRVWRFSAIGPRRTQTMRGGLLDTAPFHWDGDMSDIRQLLHEVFEGRMSGQIFRWDDADFFAAWMDSLPALPRPGADDAEQVERGRALFHDTTVGCATCHVGDALTNNTTVDVGTGKALQVPTLLGIAYRAPYMHDGCAPTLRARLENPSCGGGDAHGRTSHLSSDEIDDLVAYLRTL